MLGSFFKFQSVILIKPIIILTDLWKSVCYNLFIIWVLLLSLINLIIYLLDQPRVGVSYEEYESHSEKSEAICVPILKFYNIIE